MKKSKLLQSSKEMLSRSFNPAKCKTSLRMAASRLKILKNKKEVQVKQMRQEIAQLLESGQDQTARMRVEHVIREEKMMAAYDLLEIYSELIIARLPIIESQKSCPIDLKEAIASVIFASLRCGDVPELLDVRKQLSAKYGKDFTTAAIELRPQSGVGRMLVEKLSAMAPDVQTKNKILSAIAKEHNVKWDQEPLEEGDSTPSSDLSGGESAFGKESQLDVGQPSYAGADSQVQPITNKINSDPRISTETSVAGTTCQPEARPQGDNRAQLFKEDNHTSSPSRQRWNMEFKDATSAAQAAAESAELASMAAKAAAELSMRNKIGRQDSTESHGSDAYISNVERPETHSNTKLSREQFLEESLKKSSPAPTRSHNEQIDRIYPNDHKTATRFKEDSHGGPEEYSQLASLNSKSSRSDEPMDYGVPVVDQNPQKNPLEEVSRVETSVEKQSFKHEVEPVNDWAVKVENHPEKRNEKLSSSHSHSSISDDVNIFANSEDPKYGNNAGENLFVDISEEGIRRGEDSHQTTSHEDAALFYDKFDSDTDDHGFDLGPKYDDHYSGFNLTPPSPKSPEHPPVKTDSWSPRFKSTKTVDSTSPPLFFTGEKSFPDSSENLTSNDDTKVDSFTPVTYDDSDGPSSDIEEDLNVGHHEVKDSIGGLGIFDERESSSTSTSHFENISKQSVGSPLGESGVDRKQLSNSSDDELRSEELNRSRTKVKTPVGCTGTLSLQKHSTEHPALGLKESQELNDIGDESSSGSEEGLSFGKLTGGLRNRGGRSTIPFLKNRLNVSSSVKKETEKTTETTGTSTKAPVVERPQGRAMLYSKKSIPILHSETDSDSSEDEILQRHSHLKQNTDTRKDVQTKSSLGTSKSFLGSDSSDLDEHPPKESLTRKSHLQSGVSLGSDSSDLDEGPRKESRTRKSHLRSGVVSRRTRAPPSSGNSSNSEIHLKPEANDVGFDRKPITSNSETRKKNEAQRRSSGERENSDQPTSEEVASKPTKSIFWGPPERHDPVKTTSVLVQESRMGLRPEVHNKPTSLGEKSSDSYSSNDQPKVQLLYRNSSQWDNSDHPTSPKMASKPTTSSLAGAPEKQNSGKATSTMHKPKIIQKSSTVEEPSKPPKMAEALLSGEVPKAETSNKIPSNKNDSPKRASHVHPKLPDYDTLYQSLRMNRS